MTPPRGTTLLEVLIAMSMAITVIVVLSMLFPKISLNMTNNRRRLVANGFALSRLNELKAQPYLWLPLNPAADFGATPNCDCNAANLSVFPSTDAVIVDGGVSFVRRVCINLADRVGTNWTSACPDSPLTSATDKGLKNIRVQISWTAAGKSYAVDSQSMVSSQ